MHNRILRHPIPAWVSLLALVTTTGTLAQEDSKPLSPAPDTSAKSGTLEEVVVVAQRRQESSNEVPLSLTVQSGGALEQAGINSILDLGKVVPSLSFDTQGPFAAPTIRGVQSMIHQAGSESPVAIYLDGVYQNNQSTTIFELADIEQVTVLRGPQGTLFGRNATAGAILIETKKPRYETSGKVSVDYGEFIGSDQNGGDVTVKGHVTAPLIDDVLAFSLSGYYRDMSGFLENDLTQSRVGEIEASTIRAKLLFEPADWASLLLMVSSSDRDDYYSGSTTALNGISAAAMYPDGVAANEPWHVAGNIYDGTNPIWVGSDSYSLKADFDLGFGNLSSITNYTDNEARYYVDLDTGTSAICRQNNVCLEAIDDNPNEVYQQELVFASDQFGDFSFVAGAFYYHDDARIHSLVKPFLTPDGILIDGAGSELGIDNRAIVKTRAYAVFGEVNYDITEDWHLILGLRYSDEEKWGEGNLVPRFPTTGDVEDDAYTPRVSVRYDISPETNVYFTYSEGFKSAVLVGTNQSDDFAEPEKLKSYEVGFKTVQDRYHLSASAFVYDYSEMQAQFWNGTASVLSNAEGADIYGLEVEGTFSLSDAFQVQGGISWIPKSEYDEFSGIAYDEPLTTSGLVFNVVDGSGDRMMKSPKFTANLTASYRAESSLGSIISDLSLFHTSEYWYDLLQEVKQDAYTTVNARVTLTPRNAESLDIAVYGRNLTNEEYFTSTLLGPSAHAPVYSPPRQVGISLDFHF